MVGAPSVALGPLASTIPVTGSPWVRCHCRTASRVAGPKKARSTSLQERESLSDQIPVEILDLFTERSDC